MHMHKAHLYNLKRLRMGAWKLKVNIIHLHRIKRDQRHCPFCAKKRNFNITEDEEHVMIHCPDPPHVDGHRHA